MARTKKRAEPTDAPDDGWGTPVAGTPSLGSDKSMADVLRDDDRAKGQPGRGRTWLILLTSLIAQLVVVGAAGNPGVVGSASDYAREHTSLLGRFAQLPSVVSWRIQQPTVDPGNLLVSEWFGLLALVVLAALLTLVLVRGPVTFWRTGVAVWLAVIVATLANGMVRRGVVNSRSSFDDLGGKAGGVLFAGTGYEVIAGVVIGLVAAIAAAIVAVMTRRPAEVVLPAAADEPAPYVEPASPPPWHGDAASDAESDTESGVADRPTYATRSYAAPYEAAYGAGAGAAANSAAESATTALPAQRGSDDWRDAEVTTQFSGVPAAPAGGASAYERPAAEPAEAEPVSESAPPEAEAAPVPNEPAPAEPEPAASEPEPVPAAAEPAPEPTSEPASDPAAYEPAGAAPASESASDPTPASAPEPPAQAGPDQTAVFPAVRAEPQATGPAVPHSDFPRPPDDEDFGHHPSEDDADRPRADGR